MKDTHQIGVAGVGTAIGAVMLIGAFLGSCAPGKLPCGEEKWEEVCALEPGGGQGGQSGGGGGGGQGGGTPPAGGELSAATEVANCSAFNTVGKMDEFFAARCGIDGATNNCHGTRAIWTDFKSPEVWKRLLNKDPVVACKPSKLIDGKTWAQSMVWVKTKPMPACPLPESTPTSAGKQMPEQDMMPKTDLLNADELACLESYLKVIAEKTPD